jgi:glycine/D-amino acid oxidase-like deaminating enzyme
MNSRSYDVAVIGAGIVGAACAYELSNSGLRVAIVDERGVGTGATNAGMGHLLILDDSEAQFDLTRYSLKLWNELAEQLPPECEFWRCGTVWVAEDEEELEFAQRRCAYFQSNGVPAQFVDSAGLAELEPNLRPGLPGGAFVPGDTALVPSRAAEFLIAKSCQSRAEFIAARVIQVGDEGVVTGEGTKISAAAYVNATGTAAASLMPGLPIRSRKGHILVVNAGPGFARHQAMELGYLKSAHAREEQDSVAFAVRHRKDGDLLIGASRQYGVDHSRVEPEILERMLTRAIRFMPALAKAPQVTSWTGFRAGTPDGLPLIGLFAGSTRTYVASGHEGLGVTTSLATARLLADAILGRSSEICRSAFSPARFATKEI